MIVYHKEAEKFLLLQDKKTALRISTAIWQLPNGDVKPLKGMNKPQKYRLRVGGFRIIFRVEKNATVILRIDTRGDVYK